jgi:serine phosphatase RsbU (regulator of sigma subunit)
MHELHLVMSDSINNQEDQRASAKQQAKYEYEKQKSLDDAAYEKQLAVEQGQQQKQKVISYSAGGGLVLILGFLLFVFNRLKVTREQKAAIDTQKQEIEKTHEQLSEHHKKLSDSITYAQRLQRAILPSAMEVSQHIKENFILFKPKDVVSGDFYWFEHTEGTSYIAAADCTGHGVPGAMVSVVCSNALNRCIKEFGLREPSKILDKTRDLVIETFAKSGDNVKDGMDIAVCAIKNSKLTFAGANNPLWIVRQTEHVTDIQKEERSTYLGDKVSLIEYKASKQPIGLYEGMKPFEQQEIELYKGDSIYIFSDGFADQFGGPKRKKLKHKPFKKLLLDLADTPMNQQSELILSDFNNWKGDHEQVDDVVVIGIRI